MYKPVALALSLALFATTGVVAQQPPASTSSVTLEAALKGDAAWWKSLSADDRGRVTQLLLGEAMESLSTRGKAPDMTRAAKSMDALLRYAPPGRWWPEAEGDYLKQLDKTDPKAAAERLEKLARASGPDIEEFVANRRFVQSLATRPVDFKYRDIDGNTIDLAQYRGKVVLLDFWATWCKPCMAEMPNIRATYDKYRAQGFEVIGVTDDSPLTEPGQDPSRRFTVESLKAFMDKAGMNWPQLWDRSAEDDGVKPLLKKFEVEYLPTTFLFGKDGRLITRDNKGEKLDRNVRVALGLDGQVAAGAQGAPAATSTGEAVLSGNITGLQGPIRLRVSQPFQEADEVIEVGADGKFTYSRKVDGPTMFSLSQAGAGDGSAPVIPRGFEIILAPGARLTLQGSATDPASMAVKGDRLNDTYARYKAAKRPFDEKHGQARRALREAEQANAPAEKLAELRAQREKAMADVHRFQVEFTRANPDNYGLLNELASDFLAYEDRGQQMEEAFMALSPTLRASEAAKYIPGQIKALKATSMGAVAPDFTRTDMNGRKVSLKDFRGKYVVLDFWGSWCGPCRQSHPGLIEVYRKYKDKGLEIIGVALENDDIATARAKWLKAIGEDGIELWTQVLNNEETPTMNIVESYGIVAYPTKILLDPQGRVIGKYLGTNEDVKPKLHELFAK